MQVQGTRRPLVGPVDVAIIGGGLAGLVAALSAARQGRRVALFEASARPGGNARIAAGVFIASDDLAALRAYVPDGDPALQALFVEGYPEAMAFLEREGLPLGALERAPGARVLRAMGVGQPGRRDAFVDALIERVRAAGVQIIESCPVRSIEPVAGGYCIGLKSADEVRAAHVVIATGGFAASPDLLAAFMGPGAVHLRRRSLDGAAGDGLRLARSLGAALRGDMAAYYGHTMADCPLGVDQWQPLTPYFARLGILVDRRGRRFTDESASFLEESNPQAATRAGIDRYWMIVDERIRTGDAVEVGIAQRADWLQAARSAGVPLVVADSLEALAAQLAADGVDADALVAEIARFNAAVRAGVGATLVPPRQAAATPLERAPFYAMRAVAGITATCGGIAVDAECRVIASNGLPLAGLYAAGVDAGGVFGRTYAGFLSWCAVSGRRAGLSAARAVRLA
jgi:succinate dehydrogenase/fumarate reductase flavoprotein subunit